MRSDGRLSVGDKVLLAAYHLEENGRRRFTAEDLVVAAWRAFPATFGLSGHAGEDGVLLYPDSNRVFAEIMGSKPLRKLGLLEKVGPKTYSLTESGRNLARELSAAVLGFSKEPEAKTGLARDTQRKLERLLGSRAVSKIGSEEVERLTFHDACLFWSVAPQSSAMHLMARLSDTAGVIQAARRVLRDGQASLTHRGEPLTSQKLDLLQRTHDELCSRFKEELDTMLAKRADERRN